MDWESERVGGGEKGRGQHREGGGKRGWEGEKVRMLKGEPEKRGQPSERPMYREL